MHDKFWEGTKLMTIVRKTWNDTGAVMKVLQTGPSFDVNMHAESCNLKSPGITAYRNELLILSRKSNSFVSGKLLS